MFHEPCHQRNGSRNQDPAVDYFYSAAEHRLRGALWPSFAPARILVIFTSNMFGPSYVFGAETAKAVNPPPADVISTPELAKRFNPTDPPNSKGPVVPAASPAQPAPAQ